MTRRFIAAIDPATGTWGTYDTQRREWMGHASTVTGARIKAGRLNTLNPEGESWQ